MKRGSRLNLTALGLAMVVGALVLPSAVIPGADWSAAHAQQEPPPIFVPLVLKNQRAVFTNPPTIAPTPTSTPIVFPSETPTITMTPTPTATPTFTPAPTSALPEWQQYINYHRALAKLPPVTENDVWSRGGELHSKYMVKNNVIGHSESPAKPFYTAEGNEAARNGNVYLSYSTAGPGNHKDAINGWMTGPFHMLAIIDPQLRVSGFGEYSEQVDRFHRYGATLDVLRGQGDVPPGVTFPVYYPENGREIPNLAYTGGEFPNPLATCPGYREPTGPPIALQLGSGKVTPDVKRTSFSSGGQELPHCWFDETTYPTNPGKGGLNMRDAVVIMPRSPLTPDQQYSVTIEANGETYEWSFTAGGGSHADSTGAAPLPAPPLPER